MTQILEKVLAKSGVKNFFDMNTEEKETYSKWEEVLNGRKLTDDEVKDFLDLELEETISKLATEKLNSQNDLFLKVKLEMLRKIKGFLNGPEIEKKAVERQLKNII